SRRHPQASAEAFGEAGAAVMPRRPLKPLAKAGAAGHLFRLVRRLVILERERDEGLQQEVVFRFGVGVNLPSIAWDSGCGRKSQSRLSAYLVRVFHIQFVAQRAAKEAGRSIAVIVQSASRVDRFVV